MKLEEKKKVDDEVQREEIRKYVTIFGVLFILILLLQGTPTLLCQQVKKKTPILCTHTVHI